MDAKGVPSKDTGRIQIGISVHGYAGIVLDAVVAVDEIADAARGREQLQHTTNGIGPIEPVLVVAVFAPRAVMLCYAGEQSDLEDFPIDFVGDQQSKIFLASLSCVYLWAELLWMNWDCSGTLDDNPMFLLSSYSPRDELQSAPCTIPSNPAQPYCMHHAKVHGPSSRDRCHYTRPSEWSHGRGDSPFRCRCTFLHTRSIRTEDDHR